MPKPRLFAWNRSATLAANARVLLPPLARAYFQHGRKLMDGEWSAAEFHRFRLRTKRFRYTLELFRPFYGPSLEHHLAELRDLQDFLGIINDCATTSELVAAALPGRSPHRRRLDAELSWRAGTVSAELRAYWRDHFNAPGQEQRWLKYLAAKRRT